MEQQILDEAMKKFNNILERKNGIKELEKLFKKGKFPINLYKANAYYHLNDGNVFYFLFTSAESMKSSLFKMLLDNSPNINEQEFESAMQMAIVHGNFSNTKIMLSKGIKPTNHNIIGAISNGELNIFLELIKYVELKEIKKELKPQVKYYVDYYNSFDKKFKEMNKDLIKKVNYIYNNFFIKKG